MTGNKSLAAVLVTYNRAEKLDMVLTALEGQTRKPDAVYVIDNASTDTTPEIVAAHAEHLPVVHHRLAENIGGAGGLHAGIKLAWENGHDLFWISDDDAYPKPDAIDILERRMLDFEAETGWKAPFACSRVEWTDGSLCEMNVPVTVWDWPRWFRTDRPVFLVSSCSFVSVLLRREAVTRQGLPIADYFIWHDDIEYTRRLSKIYPGLFCVDSTVIHDIPDNKGVNFGLVNKSNAWKYYYGVRNETSRRLRDEGIFGVVSFLRHIRGQTRGRKIGKRITLGFFKAILRGLVFRPQIEVPEENPVPAPKS